MSRKSRKNVGVIGLGIIGSRVAAALRAAGYSTYVWNRSPRPEPNFLSSPAEVAQLCNVIQFFVADARAMLEVLDMIGDALTEKHTVICNATIGPEATIEVAKIVALRGARFLDAPFTGSKIAAEKRQLTYYIGGDDETLAAVEPILQASSKAIVKIGEVGQAATIKIATNMMVAIGIQALVEAYAVVKKSGIDPQVLGAALEHHGIRSALTDLKLPYIIEQNFEPHFSLKHMFKDAQIAIHIANELGIDIPATTACAGVMYGGLSRGWGDLDFCSSAKNYEAAPVETGFSENGDGSNDQQPTAVKTAAEANPEAAAKDGEPGKDKNEPEKVAAQKSEPVEISKSSEVTPPGKNVSASTAGGKPPVEVESVVVGKVGEETSSTPRANPPHPLNRVKRWFARE